jgi:capsular polysaccharide biosynthesis protein
MELRDYLKIIRKHGWIIVVAGLVAALAAIGVSKVQTPIYKASIQLSVEPARLDWSLSNTLKDVLRNYVVRLNTHKMARKVIARAGLDMSTDELLSKITITTDASNFTVQIDAKDPDPATAARLAQSMAEQFVQERQDWNKEQDKSDQVAVGIVDNVRQAELYRPQTKMNALIGLGVGVIIGALIVFILEWLESDIVRTAGDVERFVGWTVLGTIPASAGAPIDRRTSRLAARRGAS